MRFIRQERLKAFLYSVAQKVSQFVLLCFPSTQVCVEFGMYSLSGKCLTLGERSAYTVQNLHNSRDVCIHTLSKTRSFG